MSGASLEGLCPRCLISLNLSSPTEAPTGYEDENRLKHAKAPPVLSLDEIIPLFPELEIIKFLGRGGMGAVYMARQRHLNRLVALKILPPLIGKDVSFASRFSREAQALARLNHNHIVTLYEFGQKGELFYFLMEYVDGVNLRQLLNAGRMAPEEALAIVPQICDALQYAHEQGIVHRDVKPENLLLSQKGEIKIADFGVAKLVLEGIDEEETVKFSGPVESKFTQARSTLGTPQYMAPEQKAHPLQVDHRADIYSLGVVFYQMLTGELPTGKFHAPSNKVSIDVRLDRVVLRALEKEPERRYQHISEIRSELETIHESTKPHEPAKLTGANFVSKKSRLLFGSVSATVVILLILTWLAHFLKLKSGNFSALGAREGWQKLAAATLLQPRSSAVAAWTGTNMIVFGGEGLNVSFGDGAQFDPALNVWAPLLLQGAAPSARTCASAVWTGSAMIVWGGFGGSDGEDINRGDGGRFYPSNNVWRPVSVKTAPEARSNHAAIWTGSEMLIWGGTGGSRGESEGTNFQGFLNTGGRYNPVNDTWQPISNVNAPSKRNSPVVVWTGTEMIVWGGRQFSGGLEDGARYNPANDSWRPMSRADSPSPRSAALAVWTGKVMIVWSGMVFKKTLLDSAYLTDGASYNPTTDVWRPITTNDAPSGRITTSAIWTGKEMLVIAGVNDSHAKGFRDSARYVKGGALYDPETDSWREIANQDAPTLGAASAMVWTGRGLLAFGGYNGKHQNETYFYQPPADEKK